MATANQIQQLYIAYFQRPADLSGLNQWLLFPGSLSQIAAAFGTAPEFKAVFSPLTVDQQVNQLYRNLYSRDASSAEISAWAGEVNAGRIDIAQLGLVISNGSRGSDLVAMNNKIISATSFTNVLRVDADARLRYSGELAAQVTTSFLEPINAVSGPASPSAVADAIAGLPPVGTVGLLSSDAPILGIGEGGTVIFTIETIPDLAGQTIAYELLGVQAADIEGGALTGNVLIGATGVGVIQVTIARDFIPGETETLQIAFPNNIIFPEPAGSNSVVIIDTTPAPVINVVAQPTAVSEGGVLTFGITTTSIAPGSTLTYEITGIQAADVLGGVAVLSGTRTVNADGTVAPVQITFSEDFNFNEQEVATILVSNGAGVSGTATAEVVDTTLPLAINVVAQPTAVSEGGVLTFGITTTSIAPGSTLTYVITGIDAADVLGGAAVLSGTRTVNADGTVAPVQITISADLLVETQEVATITVSNGAGLSASASAGIIDTSSSTFQLTTNADLFDQSAQTADLLFVAPVVPGGLNGFNTLQNIDSLVGGSGQDSLVAELVGGVFVQPISIRSIETVAITSLSTGFFESLPIPNTISLLTSDSVEILVNFSSTTALTFTNIPGIDGGLPVLEIQGTNAATTLQFQPVAIAGLNDRLDIFTTASGVNVNAGFGAPLQIITGEGIESAVITDTIQVPDFQVDYDLSGFDVPTIEINSPNNIRLNGRVNIDTTSIDGSGIDGVFTVDLSSQPGDVSIQGGAGNDLISGREGDNTLNGNSGNDSLVAFDGNDSFIGGTGNDTMVGGEGNNSFNAGADNDSITAGSGNDNANGDAGNDTIVLGAGNNIATGGTGNDTIVTLDGADTLEGNAGDDSISSGDGNDVVNGDAGNDTINFGTGVDSAFGGIGNDYFIGELTPGAVTPDIVDGGEGVNTLEITATNADQVANVVVGTPFVDNIQILNISGTVGANPASNQVDASLIDNSIATVNLFNGTGATPAVFTFNPGSSTLNISTQTNFGQLGAAATFNVVGSGTADSLTINGPAITNYLIGRDLTFNGFDANTVTINAVSSDQTIGTITTTPTAGQDSRFVFQGSGGFTIANVVATAGDLTLDFTGSTGVFGTPFAIVNGTDVVSGSTVSILGSAGADTFVGDTAQPNIIQSFGGNDAITVGSGNDSVLAGTGNDTITPGTGNDTVLGEAGNDRFNVGDNLTLADRFNGGDDIDTIQLTGKLGIDPIPGVIAPFAQGYTASDLEGVSNFEVLELEVNNLLVDPLLITVQDLFNFEPSGNILQSVNLTNRDQESAPDVLLYNASSTLVNLGIFDTLDEVTLLRRTDGASDSLNVTLVGGADLTLLDLRNEETISFFISGDTVIDTLIASDLTTLNVSGFGSFVITNPIIGATQLSVLNLSEFSDPFGSTLNSIFINASVSSVDMTVTGPAGGLSPYELELETGSGNDNITALGFGANTIDSNAGNDTIITGGFADRLTAGLGNDLVFSGDGNDTVFADQGNDTVEAGIGDDLVFGDFENIAGNDRLFGGAGNDTLSGGLGADTIDGGADIDTYVSGFTVVFAPPGVQDPANTGQILGQVVNLSNVDVDDLYISGVTGLSVAASIEDVAAGTANYLYNLPLPLFGGSPVTDVLSNIENVDGTNGNDFLIGSGDITTAVEDRDTAATQNLLNGLDGNDTYQGGYGADTFINDSGVDEILDLGLIASGGYEQIIVGEDATTNALLGDDWEAGTGEDGPNSINDGFVTINLNGYDADLSNSEGSGLYTINGTDGDEIVFGSANDDLINGGGGNDILDGLGGNDTVNGQDGDDFIIGGEDNDLLNGGFGNDTLLGLSGADTIFGTAGADSIDAGAGDDSVEGGSSTDTIFGGIGNDFIDGYDGISLDDLTDGDSIDGELGDDTIQGNDAADSLFGGFGLDSIAGGTGDDSIDGGDNSDIIDGGDGADVILGGDGRDSILGGLGADTILGEGEADTIDAGDGLDSVIGGEGDDSIIGGLGSDTLFGGNGNDTFTGNDGDDSIVSDAGIDSALGGNGNDTISLGASADTLFGDAGNDSLVGGDGNDVIRGGADNDTIEGGLGRDNIDGGDGNDSIDGGNDNDTIDGEAGNDFISGGEGNDNLDGGTDQDTILGGLGRDNIDGDNGNDSIDGGEGNDVIEGDDGNDTIEGGLGNDDIEGNDGVDSLLGGAGNDTIEGGADADTIDGGLDNDSIVGGFGNDTIDGGDGDDRILGGTRFVELDLLGNDSISGGAGNDIIDGGAGDDALDGGTGNDSLQGDGGTDFISGGDGNDTIDGGGEDDLIFGGAAIDFIEGGSGNDIIDGEAGDDTIRGETGDDNIDGGLGNDTIDGGDGNDTIVGGGLLDTTGDDSIFGGAGNDNINGAAGNDTIDGQDGDDTIDGSFGNDDLRGGSGNDVISGGAPFFFVLGGNDTIDGGFGDDTITGVDGNDSILGGAGSDNIVGGDGNDVIDGGNEDDTITGDAGDDSILGGAGDDNISGGAGSDTIGGGDGNDVIAGDSENDVIDGGNDNDTITGDAGNDSILGGAGDDNIGSGAGSDTIGGGDGNDVIAGGDSNDTIDGGANNDIITGDDGEDSIFGGANNDTVDGGADNDSIFGQDGDDRITGLTGNDSIDGGDGADVLSGFDGTDTILGAAGNDTIDGGIGEDTVDGGANDDSIFAGAGADSINGNTGNDFIEGEAGADILLGDTGNDTLVGGNDDDSLVGGNGDDSYIGGTGIDTFIVSSGTDQISDLGLGGLNEIVQVSAGATLTATLGANWTATAASANLGTGTINLFGFAANLSQITGTTGWSMQGSSGSDTGIGSIYDDTISGGASSDILAGGDGNDSITGGTEVDQLTGGLGNNIFGQAAGDSEFVTFADTSVFVFGNGVDQVTNFNSLNDKVNFIGAGATDITNPPLGFPFNNVPVGNYFSIGDFVGDTFIIGATGDDVLLFRNTAVDFNTFNNIGNSSIVLNGAAANWNAGTNVI